MTVEEPKTTDVAAETDGTPMGTADAPERERAEATDVVSDQGTEPEDASAVEAVQEPEPVTAATPAEEPAAATEEATAQAAGSSLPTRQPQAVATEPVEAAEAAEPSPSRPRPWRGEPDPVDRRGRYG